ncbi:MAG: hypothetical protein DRI71_07450 [Bacteroidetes bacterium]|nr:MAG: hypothetical protein DRI71_07450 [Bacteroidota bacterium]
MKNNWSVIYILVLSGLFLSCNSGSTNPEELATLQDELLDANTIIDSIKLKVAELEDKNLQLYKNNAEKDLPVLTRDEAAVHKMVANLKKAFNNIYQDKNPDKILRFFLPSFSTKHVTINIDNEAEIALFSSEDFKKFLKKQIREKGIFIEMEKITFLDTQIKGEIFTTTFKNVAKVYRNNTLITNRVIVSTITGRNKDGWKIGNYSWVSIDYAAKN